MRAVSNFVSAGNFGAISTAVSGDAAEASALCRRRICAAPPPARKTGGKDSRFSSPVAHACGRNGSGVNAPPSSCGERGVHVRAPPRAPLPRAALRGRLLGVGAPTASSRALRAGVLRSA